MGHNRNLADYAHHFDGTNIDLGSGNIETDGVVTYEDVTNVDAIGIVTARAGVKVPDNQKVFLGTGDDFAITHDGSNTTFINDTGQIQIRNRADDQDIILQTDDGSGGVAVYLRCDGSSGQVDLNHYGSRKFYTSSTGATVNGTLVSDSVTSELDLSAISSSISGTAVDIFVYDTRKDSDGGAWRKRTQHTSWYNETLNTSTRGSRKEFPAVAVIVTTATNVTIYDGDDPDLPMWMDFQSGSYYFIGPGDRVKNSAHMLNGILCVTKTGSISWMSYISFVDDKARQYSDNDGEKRDYLFPISYRNASNANSVVNSIQKYTIVNDATNDVAMTVLPNAPIDDATGLPVPTIAVATDGGVSVIKDDGNVLDDTSSSGVNAGVASVEFVNDTLYYGRGGAGGNLYVKTSIGSVSANFSASHYYRYQAGGYGEVSGVYLKTDNDITVTKNKNDVALFGDTSLVLLEDKTTSSLVAYVTTSYNTGWMHGDIKGAFLSDTTVESLTANTNLASSATQVDTGRLTSETYDNGDTSWQMVDNAGSANGYLTIRFSGLTVGQSYIISMTWDNNATLDSGYNHRIDHNSGGSTNFTHWNKTNASSETLTGVFVATSQNNEELVFYANAITLNVTNFNIRAIDDEDRSVNNKGLAVYGTVTKSAVATGAELVSYGPFSINNYLKQPYNSDLAFAADDEWCFIIWADGAADSELTPNSYPFSKGYYNGSTWLEYIDFRIRNNGDVNFEVKGTLGSSNFSSSRSITDNNWHQYVFLKRGSSNYEGYIDGQLVGTTEANVGAFNNTNSVLMVGTHHANAAANSWDGRIALLRVSASAPSAEQVKKIYEDEKVLFQENAKATLYGSSDAVTALAYDEDTELLHVGTSSGRSDFQGLRRINNTTTAVTTAISASDELIAEQ